MNDGELAVVLDLADHHRLGHLMVGAHHDLEAAMRWLDQAALAEMIRGSYAAHLARIRVRYGESRDSLLLALRRQFGAAQISGAADGLHLLWRLPPGVPDAPLLEDIARRAKVGAYCLASAAPTMLRTAISRGAVSC